MKRNGMISMVMAAGLVLGGAGVAFAATPSHQLSTLDHAKTSMRQAITIAQNITGGKAVRVAFNRANGHGVYRIRTATKHGMDRVVINAANGTVTTVASATPALRTNNQDPYHVFSDGEYQPDRS